jgi:dienelactone hydrolase
MGATKFSMAGFCWGGWIVFEASKDTDKIQAGLTYHPSLNSRITVTYDQLGSQVKCPHLGIITKQEPVDVKSGGLLETSLKNKFGDKIVWKTYETMSHGFVNRGDLADATIKTTYEEVLTLSNDFLQKNSPIIKTTSGFALTLVSVLFGLLFY